MHLQRSLHSLCLLTSCIPLMLIWALVKVRSIRRERESEKTISSVHISSILSLLLSFAYTSPGLNNRLGTNNLTISEIIEYCDTKNISIVEVMAMPELVDSSTPLPLSLPLFYIISYATSFNFIPQESYVYPNPTGPRMVCDVFAMKLYKAAGTSCFHQFFFVVIFLLVSFISVSLLLRYHRSVWEFRVSGDRTYT